MTKTQISTVNIIISCIFPRDKTLCFFRTSTEEEYPLNNLASKIDVVVKRDGEILETPEVDESVYNTNKIDKIINTTGANAENYGGSVISIKCEKGETSDEIVNYILTDVEMTIDIMNE